MRRVARLLMPLLGMALLALQAQGALAERFPRELQDIKIYGKGETVEFVFSQPYEGQPVVEHKPGYFSLSFTGTGSSKPVRALRPVEESIFSEIKVVENRYSTTVGFQLRDRKRSLEHQLSWKASGNALRLSIGGLEAQSAAPGTEPQRAEVLQELEQRVLGDGVVASQGSSGPEAAGNNAPTPLGGFQEGSFYMTLLTMIVALVIIVVGLYGVLFLYNRFVAHRLRRFTGNQAIRQLASFHIGPRQRIVVLDINGEKIACGVTPGQITYLTHLGGRGHVARRPATAAGKAGQTRTAPGQGTPSPAGQPGQSPTEATPKENIDPVHQFAEVLKEKVRSLKRIN